MLRATDPPTMLLQIPGGPELLIILLVMALLVGVPVVIAALFLFVKFVGGGDDDEVAELKGRIEELEAQVASGSEAAHNDVTVPDDRAASETSGEDGSASSGDDGENGR
jgi:sec-independent protein translocase protein TatA